jgi:transcriptional regulator with XRE-family HTH domain
VKTTVGQKIRKIREARDFTQDNLAFELGITKSAYSKIEREQSNVSVKRLEQIAKALEVDIVEFFKETNLEETQRSYGFATKGDVEELAKMIQELAKEISNLKTTINVKSPTIPKKSKAKK